MLFLKTPALKFAFLRYYRRNDSYIHDILRETLGDLIVIEFKLENYFKTTFRVLATTFGINRFCKVKIVYPHGVQSSNIAVADEISPPPLLRFENTASQIRLFWYQRSWIAPTSLSLSKKNCSLFLFSRLFRFWEVFPRYFVSSLHYIVKGGFYRMVGHDQLWVTVKGTASITRC